MSILHSRIANGLAVACLLFVSVCADAQQRREREGVRCSGKVKAVGPRGLQVEGEKGEQWLIGIDSRPQSISFQATATPAFLRPGMLVQFHTSLDKKAEAQTAIAEIKVVTLREGIQPGLVAEGAFGGGGLFASKDDTDNNKKKKVSADATPFVVTGTLRGMKDRKFQVAAGTAVVKGELSESCVVSLDTSDWSLARPGDAIEVNGWRYPEQANQIFANRMSIVADKPLVPVEEGRKRKPGQKGADKSEGNPAPKSGSEKSKAKESDSNEKKNGKDTGEN